MALLFSHVRASTPDGNEAEFLVMGIPREYEDLEGYTKLEEFLNELDEDTEISFHADAYLYGEGETFSASIEEVVRHYPRSTGYCKRRFHFSIHIYR